MNGYTLQLHTYRKQKPSHQYLQSKYICTYTQGKENMQKIFGTTEHEKLHTIYPDKLLLMHSQVLCIYNTQKPYGSWEMEKKLLGEKQE